MNFDPRAYTSYWNAIKTTVIFLALEASDQLLGFKVEKSWRLNERSLRWSIGKNPARSREQLVMSKVSTFGVVHNMGWLQKQWIVLLVTSTTLIVVAFH